MFWCKVIHKYNNECKFGHDIFVSLHLRSAWGDLGHYFRHKILPMERFNNMLNGIAKADSFIMQILLMNMWELKFVNWVTGTARMCLFNNALTLSQWPSSGNSMTIQCAWNVDPSVHWNATGEMIVGSQCASSGLSVSFQWSSVCSNYAN